MSQQINTDFYNFISKKFSKKHKHTCFYPDCEEKAINSHTISKQFSLSHLAVDGKLVTPISLRNDTNERKDIVFKEKGINDATTFKGFCKEHDDLFSTVDQNGIITIRDIFLQIYRSLSKESFEHEIYKEGELTAFKNEFLFDSSHENRKVMSTSKLLMLFYDLLLDFPEADQRISGYNGNSVTLKPFSEAVDLDVTIIYKNIKFNVPVALHNKVQLVFKNTYCDNFIFLIPYKESADLIILSHNNYVEHYLYNLSTDIKTLNFIESSMMMDGEWWISPRVFDSWSNERKQVLQEDFRYFTERSFLEDYDMSIFDSVRLQLCESLNKDQKEEEIKKIDTIPSRLAPEARENLLQEKLISDISKIKFT
ncbi:hypothetical protein [Shewanella decolorationis]|uniref:hypothetical protein n=1 Tax=Shewanella decolorationis TaxID=256839 RepID=UPI0010572365|nr:hypothetical protein [Shewanella decolorationis]